MGINWNNLGAGLAVWGDVLRNMAERRKQEQQERQNAQTLGQIMQMSEIARTGEDTTPGIASIQGTNKVQPTNTIEQMFDSWWRQADPQTKGRLGMGMYSAKNKLLDTAKEKELAQTQYDQIVELSQKDPLVGELMEPYIRAIDGDPYNHLKMTQTAYSKLLEAQTGDAQALIEERRKLNVDESPYSEKRAKIATRRQISSESEKLQALEPLRNFYEIQKKEMLRNYNQSDDIAQASFDAGNTYLEGKDKFLKKRENIEKQLVNLNLTEQFLGTLRKFIDQQYTFKSTSVDGERSTMNLTGHEILNEFIPIWMQAGKPAQPSAGLVNMAVNEYMKERLPEDDQFTPEPELMDEVYSFIQDEIGFDNLEEAALYLDNYNKQLQIDQLDMRGAIQEGLAMRQLLAVRKYASDTNDPVLKRKINTVIADPSNWDYLDLSSYPRDAKSPEEFSMRLKPQYDDISEYLTNKFKTEDGKVTVDLMQNFLNMTPEHAMAVHESGRPQGFGTITDIQDVPEERSMSSKIYEKQLTWNQLMKKRGKDLLDMVIKGSQFMPFVEGEAVKRATEDESVKAVGEFVKERFYDMLEMKGIKTRPMKERFSNPQLTQIQSISNIAIDQIGELNANRPKKKRGIRWQAPSGNPKQALMTYDDKERFYANVVEALNDTIEVETGINNPAIDLFDPQMKDVKKEVDRLWKELGGK